MKYTQVIGTFRNMLEDNFSSELAKKRKVAEALHRNICRIPALCAQQNWGKIFQPLSKMWETLFQIRNCFK
jgi:hypothetical protein